MNREIRNSPLLELTDLPNWTHGSDEIEGAIVLTTRVRIARNLSGELFPARQDTEGRVRVVRQMAKVIASLPDADEGIFLSLAALIPLEVALLVERRTISPQLARDENPRGVFAWKGIDRAVMVCEEDHVRLTEIIPGLQPRQAYENLQPLLARLAGKVEFARLGELGYAAACPANLGAAVRTSMFCHLPGLVLTDGIESLATFCASQNFTVRGFWGEASDVLGNMFQLTDGPSLSEDVDELVGRVSRMGQAVIEREAMARIELQTQRGLFLKDKIARALAILQNCRTLNSAESMALMSALRLGLDIGWIEGVSRQSITMFTFELGRAYLKWHGYGSGDPDARGQRRAERAHDLFGQARFAG